MPQSSGSILAKNGGSKLLRQGGEVLRINTPSYLRNLESSTNVVSKFLNQLGNIQNHVDCLTTGPQPLSKRVLQIVAATATAFCLSFQYILHSLSSSRRCLRLLPRLPVMHKKLRFILSPRNGLLHFICDFNDTFSNPAHRMSSDEIGMVWKEEGLAYFQLSGPFSGRTE